MICDNYIDLAKPIRGSWEGRGFDRRYIYTYACSVCGAVKQVRAGSFSGVRPVLSVGGIKCSATLDDGRWFVFERDTGTCYQGQPAEGFVTAQQAGVWMQNHGVQLSTYAALVSVEPTDL